MATTTPNYGLRKPTNADTVNVVTDISGNMDLLDAHGHSGTYGRLAARDNFAAGLTSRAADGSAINAKDDALAGVFNWTMRGAAGYLLHFTTDTPGSVGNALIGLGPDAGGNGLLISNKSTGKGIYGTNELTNNTATDSYLFYGRQASVSAPLVCLESIFGGSAPLLRLYAPQWGAGQVLFDVKLSDASITEEIFAQTGEHRFYAPGIRLSASKAGLSHLNVNGDSADLLMRFYRDTGGATFYPSRIYTSTDELRIGVGGTTSVNDGTETIAPFLRMKNNGAIEGAFFGAAPIVKPTSTTDLRTALINLGLYTGGGASPLNLNGGLLTAGHIGSSGANPTVAVTANAGSGATASITGTDTAGVLQLNTGTGAAIGDQLVVTFAATYGSAPKAVVFMPASTSSAARDVLAASTATTMTLNMPTSLASSTTYYWFYMVIA